MIRYIKNKVTKENLRLLMLCAGLCAANTAMLAASNGLPDEFTDGFFYQNEDWFGHRLSSINWVDSEGKYYYNVDEKANGGEQVLGNTAQYGQIYGDYYYAMSKQNPRLVAMNAKTLEVVKSFDAIGGGDGRAVLGVAENKIYVGTSDGVFVLNPVTWELSQSAIAGTIDASLYSNQIGIMQRVGKYVFVTKQSLGVLVIDPETDTVVEIIENSNICGLTVSRDGTVWAVAEADIIRINPVTLEYDTQVLPHQMVSAWGSWMPDKMCADPDENVLYYGYGTGRHANSEVTIGKLLIAEDGTLSEDATFNFVMPAAADPSQYQQFYGKPDIDPQSGYLLITTTQSGWGTNYSNNWLHYVDRKTGEVVKTVVVLSDSGEGHYWFPSMPVFPDNHAPEIAMEDLLFTDAQPLTFNLTDVVSDLDNMPALAVWDASSADEGVFTVQNDGLHLTVTPVGAGTADMQLSVNSNGRLVDKTVSVTVAADQTALATAQVAVTVYPNPFADYLIINAATDGQTASVYDLSGRLQLSVALSAGTNRIDTSALPRGSYLLRTGSQAVKLVK